jgi:hypothetical protein
MIDQSERVLQHPVVGALDSLVARLVLDRVLGTTPVANWESRGALQERAEFEDLFKFSAE